MDLGRTLEEWLQNLDLEKYVQCFYSAGITELAHCQHLDDSFLNDIGITPLGHRKRILEHLPKISNQSRNDAIHDEVYVNYPTEPESDSIYSNCTVESQQISIPVAPKVTPPSQSRVTPQPSIRKKPVPAPRKSKVPRAQETLQITSPTRNQSPQVTQNFVALKDASVAESNTDDIYEIVDLNSKQPQNNHQSKQLPNPKCGFRSEKQNVPMTAQNDLFALQLGNHFPKNEHVNNKLDPFGNFGKFDGEQQANNVNEDVYEPIWMSSTENVKQNENPQVSKLKENVLTVSNQQSDSSPVDFSFHTPSPAAPPPCQSHFPFEVDTADVSFGGGDRAFDSRNSASFSKSEIIYENTEYLDEEGSFDLDNLVQGKPSSSVKCQPPPVITCRPRGTNSIPAQSLLDDSNVSDNTFELPPPEFPPPEFPPPPLPQNQSLPNSSQLDILDFDPLAKPSLPPVPPRPSGNAAVPPQSPGYINTHKNVTRQHSDFYSLASSPRTSDKQEFSSPTARPHQSRSSHLYSLANASSPSGFSTLSPSSDPFHGQDPFNDSAFTEECTNFNVQQDTFQSSSDNFDPFGINRERGGSKNSSKDGSLLGEIPPAPSWHEADDFPHSSLYSMASPISNYDISTDGSSDDTVEIEPSTPIQILPPSTSTRRNERAGYLYKQGGLRGNKGWRRRWVLFTGKSLRYYANSKSQVSKRIVPLSNMIKVDQNVRDGDKDKFKFNLHTRDRTFQFAAETLDDCTLWSSTLMGAIIIYSQNPPEGGEKEGGDMNDPDKKGFISFGGPRDKRFVAIKQGRLCYYYSQHDFKQASPIHEIEMKLASVKDVADRKLQLSTHYAHFIDGSKSNNDIKTLLYFDSYQDCLLWKMAIEESIANGLGDDRILDEVRKNPSNKICADCGAPDPHWASVNLGIVLCKNCAGIHRNFEHRVSKVKSLRMDTKIWTPSLIELLRSIGNENSKKFWEKHMPDSRKIAAESSPTQRKEYIEAKYKRREFCDRHQSADMGDSLNEMLLVLAGSDDLLQLMKILFSGANIYHTNTDKETPFEIAKRKGQRLQMEFLYQNGGDRSSMIRDTDEAQATKLRAEVCLDGFLMKTGSNMKDFLKRWCVLEHGCLRYFAYQKSSVAKDSIDNESMMCVQTANIKSFYSLKLPVKSVRFPEAFELSTTKEKNRVYLFAASSQEERVTWMKALAKLFCPIPMMEDIDQLHFSLAGNFYYKAGHSSEWEKTWLMIDNKVVQFTDKEFKIKQIDLRKAKNIQYQESISGCSFCTENGKCLALDIPGRALYFQADLIRDTERLQHALAKEMVCGKRLDEQQLLASDVPVVVDTCIKFIEDFGLQDEGIYRIAGVKSRTQHLLDRFRADAHSVVLKQDCESVQEVASCLKLFFRDLEEPLLTSSNYEQWLQNAANQDRQVKLDWYQYLLHQLPKVNYNTIQRLISHFMKLTKYEKENKMSKENIAIVFGPSLMDKRTNEPTSGVHTQLQVHVIGDLMTFHAELFEVESGVEDVDRNIREAMEKIKQQFQRDPRNSVMPEAMTSLKIAVHFLNKRGHSELQEINKTTTVKQAEDNLKKRFKIADGHYTLHEVVCDGALERPLHPTELLFDIAMAWGEWEEMYTKTAMFILKPSHELKDKLIAAYDPARSLHAELKFIQKKNKINKHAFEFKQSRLSYYKNVMSAGSSSPINSWNIEDLFVYHGIDPNAMRRNTNKIGLSFIKKGEKPGSKDMPFFGRALCFSTEEELLNWMSGMLFAQHPEGQWA